jgi:hypothetical protein
VCVKACGVKNPRAFEMHLCPNPECCRVFPQLDPEQWAAQIHDYCPFCGSHRFKIRAGEPVAAKRCAVNCESSSVLRYLACCHWEVC